MSGFYKQGEELAIKCLQKNGYTIIDQRQNPDYWKKDIDITAIKNGQMTEIEVKWDKKINKTNAFFFEITTDVEKNKQGWANYTQSDYIFYGDSESQIFYIIKTNDMREYLELYKNEYEERSAKDYKWNGEVKKISLGAVVPIGLYKKHYEIQELDIKQRLKENQF